MSEGARANDLMTGSPPNLKGPEAPWKPALVRGMLEKAAEGHEGRSGSVW